MKQMGAFVAVGGLTALVYGGLTALFLNVLGMNYRVGVSIAYLTSIALHFSLNRHITFRAAGSRALPQVWRYLTMAGINYLATLIIVSIVVDGLHWNVYVGVVLAVLATIVIGYVLARLWVFKAIGEDRD